MPDFNGSYYADAATPASIATITAEMAQAEDDRFTETSALVPQAAADHTLVSHVAGLLVFNTTTGVEYLSTGSAWVPVYEGRRIGMLAMTPTSVAGTNVSISGSRVVLSAATGTININGVFSSAFSHYLIKMRLKVTSGGSVGLLLRASGTDSTSGYDRQRLSGVSTTASAAQSLNSGSWEMVAAALATATHTVSLDLSAPADADYTTGILITSTVETPMTTASAINNAALGHRTASAYDGLSIALSSSTATGYITVTGINA